MILRILGSESAGNGYILITEDGILLLEAGIRLQIIKQALHYSDIGKIVGCLVTHAHGDHSKYIKEYMNAGINIYTSLDTINALKLSGHRLYPIVNKAFKVDSFVIKPFPAIHDIPTLSFLIFHKEAGNILFATDTAYIKYKFNTINQILIEANYEDSLLTNDRAVGRHMSLDTVIKFLRSNQMSKVQNIVLLHLSSGNSNANTFIQSIKCIVPNASVWVADKGITVNLNKYQF